MDNNFAEVIQLIKQSRTNAFKAVNAQLINLYWEIGKYISKKKLNQPNGATRLLLNWQIISGITKMKVKVFPIKTFGE